MTSQVLKVYNIELYEEGGVWLARSKEAGISAWGGTKEKALGLLGEFMELADKVELDIEVMRW